jgi:hypothetical protein
MSKPSNKPVQMQTDDMVFLLLLYRVPREHCSFHPR